MRIHEVKCDKCGKKEKMRWDIFENDYIPEYGWKELNGKDLCKKCVTKIFEDKQ